MTIDSVIRPKGLYTNPNPFSVSPEGALLQADNLVIDEDGTVRGRRGQELISSGSFSGDGINQTNYRPEKCWWFNNRIWVHFRRPTADTDGKTERIVFWDWDALAWRDRLDSADSITIDSSGKIKLRQCEANRRMLLCTSSGVYRTSSGTTSATTNPILAGVPRGLDPRNSALANTGTPGWEPMPDDTVCAYRVCWKVQDINKIVTTGAPSGRCVVRNSTGGNRTPTLLVGIPSGTGTTDICQIYRTQFFTILPDGTFPDPGDDMYLVSEITPTATDTANFYFTFNDICPDALMGEPLYTNPGQDGPLQEKSVPPAAREVAYFGDTAFYMNTINKQKMVISILAVNSAAAPANAGVTVGDRIQVGDLVMRGIDGGTTGFPVAGESVTGPTFWVFGVDRTTGAGSEVTRVIKTTESFVWKYNLWSNNFGGRYYAYNITGPDDNVGKILIEERAINGSVKAYFGSSRIDNPPQFIPTPVDDTSSTLGLSKSIASVNNGGITTTIITTAAHGYSTGQQIFFSWDAQTVASTNSKIPPNVYTITVTGANTFTFASPPTGAFGADAAADIAWCHLIVETAQSDSETRTNRVYWSCLQEPEAVPSLNYKDVGRNDAEGLILQQLGESLFCFKEDGLFRISGGNGFWQFDEFDPSVRLLAPESVQVVNNCIYCLTDQGVVRITESGAQVISREIENELYKAIMANISVARKESFGIGYEDDRKYVLYMPSAAADTKPTQAFVYNMFTKAWTKRTDPCNFGIVARRNDVLTDVQKLYTVKNFESWLTRERKTNSVKDFADEQINIFSQVSDTTPNVSGKIDMGLGSGIYNLDFVLDVDSIVQANASTNDLKRAYVTSVTWDGLSSAGLARYIDVETVTSNPAHGISNTDPTTWGTITSLVVYKSIPHSLTFNVMAGEELQARKNFTEAYISYDQPYFTKVELRFRTDLEATTNVDQWAYGYEMYGKFPWPLRIHNGDLIGRTLRQLVPTASQKCSQMILRIDHLRPWENFAIQAVKIRNSVSSKNVQRAAKDS